jgi:FtsP/CotA-like multicopper oxidase with cupredoxin domain
MVAPPKSPKTYVPGGLATTCGTATTWPAPGADPACEAQLAGNAQFPAPIIYAAAGDVVEIRLKNLGVTNAVAPNDPHSIHLHGLDVNAANDGVPETSLGAIPANAAMPGAGNTVVYMFTAPGPGTYMYHCHQEASIHVQMGMYGALVVYNSGDAAYLNGGPGKGFGGNLHGYNYTKDYILMLTEIDVGQHLAEQFAGARGAYNPVQYQPQYWFVNGLSFPNTIHSGIGFNWATWIAAHPNYDPLIIGSVGVPDKVLLRVINLGFETQPMHMHGFHGTIIGSDQNPWGWTGGGLKKNTLTIGSGETYEWLLDFGTWAGRASGDYAANNESRYYDGLQPCIDSLNLNALPIPAAVGQPVSNLATGCPAIPDPFTPPFTYVGGPTVGPVMPGADSNSVPGGLLTAAGITTFSGQLFPFHNHDDYKATNNGVYPGGMFTMILTTQ